MLDSIQQELAAVNRFVDILQQEQQALIQAEVDKLISISQEKLKQAELLHALERERLSSLTRQGFEANASGMERWLAEQSPSVSTAWKMLLETAKAAKQINQINGQLIQTHLQNNQQALAVLMGAANRASVYGSDGQTLSEGNTGSRIIGKA